MLQQQQRKAEKYGEVALNSMLKGIKIFKKHYNSINVYGMFEGRGHLSYFQESNTVIKATYKTPFWDCIMNNFDIFGRNEPLIWDYDYELHLSDGIHRCKQNRYSGLVFLNYYDNQQ